MDAIKTFPKFSIFFLFIMIVEILSLTVIPSFHMVSKALIMASLLGFYILAENPQNNVFQLGIIFALLGDVFLLVDHHHFFMIGLICFLVMQVCYAITFEKRKRISRTKDYIVPAILAAVGIGSIVFLWGKIESAKFGVAAYIVSIITMAVFAYLRHPKLRGYSTVVFGVLLFIISDGLLAYNKFATEIPYGQILVMLTYMIAQYCIITGHVLAGRKKKEVKEKVDSSFARHKV